MSTLVEEKSTNFIEISPLGKDQCIYSIFQAEVWRRLKSLSLWGTIIMSIAIASMSIPGVVSVLQEFSGSGISPQSIFLVLQVSSFILVGCLGLGMVSAAGRDSSTGMTRMSLLLVPNRWRLVLASAGGVSFLLFLTALVWTLIAIGICVALYSADGVDMGSLVLFVACTSLAASLVGLMAYLYRCIISNTVLAVIILFITHLILPMVCGAAGTLWPGLLGDALQMVSYGLPGTLMANAVSVGSASAREVVTGIAGLVTWCYILLLVTKISAHRP